MKSYEVITAQQDGVKGRVIHEQFETYEEAYDYAFDISVYDSRTRRCSIYKNNILVMDVL